VVAWDLHARDNVYLLHVDAGFHREPLKTLITDLEREGSLPFEVSTLEVYAFPFTQPEPTTMDYMTVRHAASLLGHTVQEILSLTHLSRYAQAQIWWGITRVLLQQGRGS
jgi:hypothetical protein